MLTIKIDGDEYFNNETGEFEYRNGCEVQLEHSLYTISKWESITKKPFLSKTDKTEGEIILYIKCMNEDITEELIKKFSKENIQNIVDYINDPMTATTIQRRDSGKSYNIITSEILYYNMIALKIPFECQHWHLNRLLTFISVCDIKNNPGSKMSAKDVAKSNAELNAARRKALHTKG